jgi:predicted secreted hydrolase
MKQMLLYVLMLLLVSSAVGAETWKTARPDYPWSFPEDHWPRDGYKTEWWYFTGHLESEDGSRFGYQFTFFRVGLTPTRPGLNSEWDAKDVIMGHASISDLSSGRHLFSEVIYRATPLLGGFGTFPDSTIAWCRGPAGTDGKWLLEWNGDAFDFEMTDSAQGIGFSLSTRALKPLVFQGPNGVSQKGEGTASHYYSYTRLATEGTVRLGVKEFKVKGESWMDKEFGSNQLAENQVGWDWFSLQLDDGREVMLYMLRDRSGRVDFGRGTVVSKSGELRYLGRAEFEVKATESWDSPVGDTTYPARWRIQIPGDGLVIEVVPELADQENRSKRVKSVYYWEGAVKVLSPKGVKLGKGYVELVGYGSGSRPRI